MENPLALAIIGSTYFALIALVMVQNRCFVSFKRETNYKENTFVLVIRGDDSCTGTKIRSWS